MPSPNISLATAYPTSRSLAFTLYLGLLVSGAPLLAAAQAPVTGQSPRLARSAPNRSITFSVGALRNAYDDLPTLGYTPNSTVYSHRGQAGGAEIAYQWAPASTRHVLNAAGAGVWVGSEAVGIRTGPARNVGDDPAAVLGTHTLYEVHLFVGNQFIPLLGENKLDVSYRLGLHVGKLAHLADTFQPTMITATSILPEFMLAIGHRRTVFGQLDAGYGAANALGNYTARLALGAGLGQQHGSTLLAGYALGPNYPAGSMGFVSANLRLPIGSNALSLEPYVASNFSRHHVFSMQAHYTLAQ